MEFVDTVTPSSGRDYWWQFEAVPDRAFWNKRDEQTTRDYLSMYYQNAYNTALLNYQNEYNSPLQQMLRYQEAGLNPFLVGNDSGNMGSSHPGASPRGSSAVTPSGTEIAGSVTQGINSLSNVLKTAQGLYDYVNFGRPLQEVNLDTAGVENQTAYLNSEIARSTALAKDAEAAWSQYWNLGQDTNGYQVSESPRARYMSESTERISSQVDQLKALVDVLYPSQKEANDARASLTMYQKQVLQGQKDAILQLRTGNDTADAILKMVCFWLLGK